MLQRVFVFILLSVITLPAAAVSVAAYASRDDVTVGESFSVTVVAVNTAASAINDFRIHVQRPAEAGNVTNLADATCSPSNCSVGAQITWIQPSLAPGEVFTASFKTTLNTQANLSGTVVTFPVAIFGAGSSLANTSLQVRSKGANATATGQRLRLSVSSPILSPGEEAIVTATVGNSAATTISFGNTLTVTLPAGLELVEAVGGSALAQQAQWNLGPINPQTSLQRLMVVRATAQTPVALSVQAALQSADDNASTRQVIVVQPVPRLRVYIEPERTWGRNGALLPVQVRVENLGGTALTQVALRARIPAGSGGSRFPSDSPTSCSGLCGALDQIVWNVGTLQPGERRSYSYRDLIHSTNAGAALIGESLRLEALATSSSGRALATSDVAIGSNGRLELHVNPALPRFGIGLAVPIELSIGNWSDTMLSLGTNLELRLPNGLDVVEADGASITAHGLSWNLGAVDPGHTMTRRIVVRARSDGSLPPWERIFRNGFEPGQPAYAPGALLAVLSNDAGATTHSFQHHGAYDMGAKPLRISVAIAPNPVQPNSYFTGEITVTNTGAVDLSETSAHLRVPLGTRGAFNASDGGTGTCSSCTAGQILSWNLGQLPAGASRTVSVALRTATTASGEILPGDVLRYNAWVRASNGVDRAGSSDLVLVRSPRNLSLAIETDHDAVQPGMDLTYTMAYGNRSATIASVATLRVPLPSGTSFVSATGGGALVGNEVVWSLGSLAPQESGLHRLVVQIGSLPEGTLVETTAALNDTANHVAFVDVVNHVEAAPALRVSVAISANPAQSDSYFTAEITVTNTDAVDLFGTSVHLRLPQGTRGASFASDGATGTCTACTAGQVLTWNIGQLPAGVSRTVSVQLRTSTAGSGDIQTGTVLDYRAWARASNGLVRAASSDLVLIRPPQNLSLAVETNHDAVEPGMDLTYSLAYGNRSASLASVATLRVRLPSGTSFVSATGGGALVGDEVVWSLGSLAPQETGLRQVIVQVGSLPEGALLETTAALTDTANHGVYVDVVNHVETAPALLVSIATSANPVQPDTFFIGEVTVTNTDSVDLFGTHVYLRLPQGTRGASNASDGGTGTCSVCTAGQILTWNLGQLPAGTSRTVTVTLRTWTTISGEIQPGDVLGYRAWARASNGVDRARTLKAVRVQP